MKNHKNKNRRTGQHGRVTGPDARGNRKAWLLPVLGTVLVFGLIWLALWLRGDGNARPSPAASLDKSKGSADAAVVVEEYGDFQ